MGLLPSMGWDKPFVYGPFAALTSLRQSLLLTATAQTALLSYLLWATQSAFGRSSPGRHLAVCIVLAAATAAPWFASTLLPDAFTPLVALGLVTSLGALPRRHRLPVGIVTAVAIAAHLSHLVLAASMLAALTLLTRRVLWRPILAFAAAIFFLLGSNLVGHGRLAVSPYGSVFALARLIGDGPARDYLARICPDPAIALCAWRNQLTDDSDQFLWDPASPFWSDPLPLPQFAAQASKIIAGTIRAEPARVLRFAYRNALHELVRVDLGDTLGPDFLADTVRPRIERWYPRAELARYDGSLQVGGQLAPMAARLIPLLRATLAGSVLACAVLLLAGLRRQTVQADFAALLLIAVAANALVTGTLSTVHDRYEARLVWIVILPFLFRFPPPAPTPRNPTPWPP